jgi:hypothetical protein
MNNQKPCGETFVTSTWEALRPSVADFIRVFLNQFLRFCEPLGLEAIVRVQFHGRLDPELALALCVLHVNVRPWLLA